MMKRQMKILFAGLGMLAFSALSAQAGEPIKDPYTPRVNGAPITLMKDNMVTQALGGRLVDLDLWVGEFVKYDDNIFNTKSNKESDTVMSTAAGFLMQAEQKDVWQLRMEGQIQRNDYLDNSKYSGFEGYFHSKGSVDFSPALSARLTANYDNYYDNMRNVEDIYAMHQFTVGTGVSVKPTPFFGVDVDYAYFGQRRDVSMLEYQDYDEHTVSLRPAFALSPNTVIYTKFDAGQAKPKINHYNTSQSYAGLVGVAWTYRDTAKVIAEAGYKYMHFDDNGTIKDTSKSKSSMTGHLRAEYGFTPDWTTGFDIAYAPAYGAVTSNSSDSNYIERLTSGLFLTYSPGEGRFKFEATPYFSHNAPSENVNYKEYGLGLGVSYVVTDWFNVNAGYRYSVTDYADQSSYDRNQITLGAALTF